MSEKYSVAEIIENIRPNFSFFCNKFNEFFKTSLKFSLLEKNAPLKNNKLAIDLLVKDNGRPFKYYIVEFYFPQDLRSKPKITSLKSQFAKEKGVDISRIEGLVIYHEESLGPRFVLEKAVEKTLDCHWVKISTSDMGRLFPSDKTDQAPSAKESSQPSGLTGSKADDQVEELSLFSRKPAAAEQREEKNSEARVFTIDPTPTRNDKLSHMRKDTAPSGDEAGDEAGEPEIDANETVAMADGNGSRRDRGRDRSRVRDEDRDTDRENRERDREKKAKKCSPQEEESLMEDSLLTMVKDNVLPILVRRKDRYLRKGLWRWIDSGITDEDYHFFLAIFNCIYQEKAVAKLIERFKEFDQLFSSSEEVVELLLEDEENLPNWVVHDIEEHSRKITKLLTCFSKMRPVMFIKETFERERLKSSDFFQTRINVFHVLSSFLSRCGYTGERENQHVLEILHEIGFCRGFFEIDYTSSRVQNALTKLKIHFPKIEWKESRVEPLREKMAKKLGLEVKDFNLSLFIPKVSYHSGYRKRNSGNNHNYNRNRGGRKPYSKKRRY